MTEKDILSIFGCLMAVAGFSVMYVVAMKIRGLALAAIWFVAICLFLMSAELHMLAENANSWDFALAMTFQSIPLVIGGTIGTTWGIRKRNSG